ncbi:DUF2516 family protein [Brachybacterium sp. GPGPB12]|uniref:DUF2516 family protein n=1 Tax=Brachybacterium sp. GPGPB12 TaxID=3023517 RepID=UPI0031345131
MIALIQMWIFLVLAVALLALEIWAFVNASRFRPDAYTVAGKRSKVFWCVLTGVAMSLGFLSLPYPIGRGAQHAVHAGRRDHRRDLPGRRRRPR